MAYTEQDLRLLTTHNKQVRMKAELLDDTYTVIDSFEGAIKDASFDQTSTSDIRRTCNLTLTVQEKHSITTDFESVWIDRMVQISVGIYDVETSAYVWYSLGRMLMTSGSTTLTATTQEVKLSLVDLMATMLDDRGSQMGTGMLISAGSNMHDAIVAIVTTFSPFKRYSIPEFEDTVPYDIEEGVGKYPYDVLKTLLNLYPYYEMFYDVNGVFTVRPIPTKTSDPVDIGASVIDPILISEGTSVDFSMVKNTTEIWGKELDAQYTALSCVTSGTTYQLTIDDSLETLGEGETFAFTPDTTSVSGMEIQMGTLGTYAIYNESADGTTYTPIDAGAMSSGVQYVVRYTAQKFVLEGESIIHVIFQEITQMPSAAEQERYKTSNACRNVRWLVNPDSPFAATINPVTGWIEREIRQVFDGGEYSDIYTTELAFERANYETWLKTRLQNNYELNMIYVPWMEINDKIQYTSPRTGDVETLIVQSISPTFKNWTMTVKCAKFYPYYPWWDDGE